MIWSILQYNFILLLELKTPRPLITDNKYRNSHLSEIWRIEEIQVSRYAARQIVYHSVYCSRKGKNFLAFSS